MFTNTLRRLREARAAEVSGEGVAEGGFTLIELMVVLLIIAILLAIAIPTFLGVTGSANDRAAQSNLTNALTEASALYQSGGQSFTTSVTQAFTSSAPEFQWTTGACNTNPSNCISFDVTFASSAGDAQVLLLAARSNNNSTCWFLAEIEQNPSQTNATTISTTMGLTTAGVWYAKSTTGQTSCTASTALGYTAWATSYSSVSTTN
jgi:type IV pilus assembly protein PilA